MTFQVAYCTDVGVRKNVNQDSLYVKQIKIKQILVKINNINMSINVPFTYIRKFLLRLLLNHDSRNGWSCVLSIYPICVV